MTFLEQNYLEKYKGNVMFNNLSDGWAAEVPVFLEKSPNLSQGLFTLLLAYASYIWNPIALR